MVEKIELPAFDSRLRRRPSELLEAERLGPNLYRLVHSPGLVEGLAAGDEIELTGEEPGYRIIKRAGNLCIWLIVKEESDLSRKAVVAIQKNVEAIGGRLDGGTHRSLIFTIPVSVGFGLVERLLNETVKDIPGATWFFGNVYDPKDGKTPLNWR